MNSYKEVLRLLKDIEQLEASQESMDGGGNQKGIAADPREAWVHTKAHTLR